MSAITPPWWRSSRLAVKVPLDRYPMKIFRMAIFIALVALTPIPVAARGGGDRSHIGGGSHDRIRYRSSGSDRSYRRSYSDRSYWRAIDADASSVDHYQDFKHYPDYEWEPEPPDASGRLKRNAAAKRVFEQFHPCPSTGLSTGPCPGYVVDHVIALKRGGKDEPSNMQWQTRAEAKAKDRVE